MKWIKFTNDKIDQFFSPVTLETVMFLLYNGL